MTLAWTAFTVCVVSLTGSVAAFAADEARRWWRRARREKLARKGLTA